MAKKYFGTDGVRGEVGQFPINPDFVLKLRPVRFWYSTKVKLNRPF